MEVQSQFIEMFGDFHNKVQIKDVCLVVSGKSIPTKLEDIDGNNPYIKVADFNIPGNEKYITIAQRYVSDDSASYSKQIPEGSVIFAKNGAASMSNKKRLTKIRCCIDMNTMAVFPKNESILSDFLFATIEAMDVSSHVRQGAIPSISPKSIEDSYIAMPTMEEQYRYVSIAKHADKSKFVGFKSQFIEMFGNPLSDVQKYGLKKLGECCELNPRRPRLNLEDSDMVSFVPMPSVSENGHLVDVADEEYGKVKKGFTYFENNDVLFAKITPCMENGKGTIAQDLTNGIGMGSTEFHVLRPINNISNAYWLLALTRMPIFRERASKNMSGTGGQKRVGAAFLENFLVGLPPIGEQQAFEAIYKQADKSKLVGHCSMNAMNVEISKLINKKISII